MQKNNRIIYLDILRVIACLSVIMRHISIHYSVKDIGSTNFWIGNFFEGLARIGVPLFVMISGTLMLDNNKQVSKDILIKHIRKMIIFFVFWSAIYCTVTIPKQLLIKHETIDIAQIIMLFIKGYYHLWFIYLIIGLYLIVPLLRLWVKKDNKKYVEYFIIISIFFTYLVPQIINIGSIFNSFFVDLSEILEYNLQLKYIGGFTTYYILGWYIHNYEIKKSKMIYFLGILGLFISVINRYILSTCKGDILNMYEESLSINVLLESLAVFIFIKNKFINIQKENNKVLKSISECSLGIYAIHVLNIAIIFIALEKIKFDYAIINIPMTFILTFILAYLETLIIKKIPIIKRTV